MKGNWLVRQLKSSRLSAWVLISLIFLYLMGLLIPQKGILGGQGAAAFRESSPVLYSFLDWFGFLDIYTSPLTIIMLILFFVNLLVVFVNRSAKLVPQCAIRVPERPAGGDAAADVSIGQIDDAALSGRIREMLGGFAFRSEGGRFIAVRNRYAPFGLVLFHMSFFLLLIGGLMLFYTRSEGTVLLTEGQDFRGKEWRTLSPPIIGNPPELVFTVNDIRPLYDKDITVDMEVDVALYRSTRMGDFDTQTISVNNPAISGPVSILISEVGVSPLLNFRDVRGQRYEYAFVSLDVLNGKRDGFAIPYTNFRMEFEFYPDYVIRDGLESTLSPKLNNPVFHAYFFEGPRLKWEGNVKPGQKVDMGPLNMQMEDLRYWAKLLVIKERGRNPLILGLAMGIIGLVWRFFFNRMEVAGVREGEILRLAVRGGQSKFSAENLLNSLVGKIKEYKGAGGPDARI